MEETGWSAHRRHAATSSRRKRAVSSFFVTRIHVVRFHARPRSSLFSSRKERYIYIYIYIPRASFLGSSIRSSRWCGPFAFASLRSRLHLLTHTPAPSPLPLPLPPPRYCIMQPLIAVLSFTHAICCSRCNPCPVTASSVQSPSR